MTLGRIEVSAQTAVELDAVVDYIKQALGEAVKIDGPWMYRDGRHIAPGLVMVEQAILELPPRRSEEG